jgi:hypothetical protein
MPDGSVGDFRTNCLFRLFPKGQSCADGRALFDLLQGDPAWPRTVLVAGRQAFSHHRSQPQRAAPHRQLQDLGGERTDYINDAEVRNAPNTHSWRRRFGLPILLVEAILFGQTDKEPTQRQLYQIAELGKPDGEPTRAPAFMRLLVDPGQPRIPGEALDFRDEIMAQIYDRGDPVPKRTLTFDIEVTDEGSTHGPAFFQRRTFGQWTRIGRLVFSEAVASYNGDFVIHFNHPTWRNDRNDPSTATRVNERKVG